MSHTDRINKLALELVRDKPLDQDELNSIATELCQIAQELERYWLDEREGEFPTPRQALALGRFMSTVMRDDQLARMAQFARLSRGGAGLSNDYLHVTLGDGYECGIDREGRVST